MYLFVKLIDYVCLWYGKMFVSIYIWHDEYSLSCITHYISILFPLFSVNSHKFPWKISTLNIPEILQPQSLYKPVNGSNLLCSFCCKSLGWLTQLEKTKNSLTPQCYWAIQIVLVLYAQFYRFVMPFWYWVLWYFVCGADSIEKSYLENSTPAFLSRSSVPDTPDNPHSLK